LRKSRPEGLESQFEMGCGFSDITGEDQPIAGMAPDVGERSSVGFMAQMKIAYSIQLHADCFIGGEPSNAGITC
jgi:hypothetical protein